jgi:hypothetical protein
MFDFWREVIINDVDTLTRELKVYKKDYVLGKVAGKEGDIYKTLPVAGTPAVIALGTLSGVVEITLGLSVGQESEYACPFGASKKVIAVEAPTEKTLKEVFAGIATVSGTTITMLDPKVKVISVVEHTINEDGAIASTTDKASTITKNVLPVGTGAWIIENLRFPTSVNTGYTSPNAAEDVDAKAKYVQYAFEYAVPKRGFHGQGAVGQEVTSVTHHVFYVKEGVNADTAFGALGTVITTNTDNKVYSDHNDQVGTTNASGVWTGTAVTRE